MSFKIFLLALIPCALGFPNQENVVEVKPTKEAPSVMRDCAKGVLSFTCIKIGAITLLEKLNSRKEVIIFPGISLVKDYDDAKSAAFVAELARSSADADEKLDKYLFYNLEVFLDSHSIRLKLGDKSALEEARNFVEEGRGRRRRGQMANMMAMAVMMKGTLMSIGMGGIAMLAGKALMTAMMSLLLSAIIGIKSLSSGGGKSTTYEIVSKPIYSHSHSHSTGHEDVGAYGHSGYGRNLNTRKR